MNHKLPVTVLSGDWSFPDKVDSPRLLCCDRGETLRREWLFSEALLFAVNG